MSGTSEDTCTCELAFGMRDAVQQSALTLVFSAYWLVRSSRSREVLETMVPPKVSSDWSQSVFVIQKISGQQCSAWKNKGFYNENRASIHKKSGDDRRPDCWMCGSSKPFGVLRKYQPGRGSDATGDSDWTDSSERSGTVFG